MHNFKQLTHHHHRSSVACRQWHSTTNIYLWDGVNGLPVLLVHTDDGLAAFSYTNPLHCNVSNGFTLSIWKMVHRLHKIKMDKMWQLGLKLTRKQSHTYQALEPSPQSFQYTSLHCVAASHSLEHLLYCSASQAMWYTPPVNECSNIITHTILHACTASQKGGHIPPHSQVLLCWTGSSWSSCPCSCRTYPPLFLPVSPECPVWLCTICM